MQKRGRPKMHEEDRSMIKIQIRLRHDEYLTIKGEAESKGETVSSWAREVLVATALGDKPDMKMARGIRREKKPQDLR